ncbi:MAG: tRNA preQ1(34) S-adenosylmethionine ribosyltransferase-isomerase QueA [Dehalococcoidia bacterium]|nr:tRNA preQ1(34) S-adenosylmethionine ribosyltransferase-isomerase QueA [Dehalococcoidia bacterium]
MRTDEFVFDLPPELIAQEPAEPRDSARLMVLRFKSQSVEHRSVRDLPELLRRGDLVVVNNTRVMAARLFGKRPDTGGKVEALLVRPFTDTTWEVLFKPARQARPGRRVVFETHEGALAATVLGRDDGPVVLEFERAFDPATVGEMPLPPYIKGFHGDPERYQTVYSRDAASAAAPTAGLHFTPGLLEQLRAGGIDRAEVTLEVGPGTFRPVSVDNPHDHILHSEHVTVPADAATAVTRARREQRRIVAVGTTVVRTLEHVSRERGAVEAYDGWTGLRILPGDRFQVVNALLTNFHLPKSTLLMLVCAFAGQEFVMEAYREAVRERYRFFSFGDAMLLLPE